MTFQRLMESNPLRFAFLIFFIFFFAGQGETHAQLVNGRLVTSLYTWEQFDTVGSSRTYTRGMQSLLLGVSEGSLSIHTHLQVAPTLRKTLDEEPDFRSYYLYARIRDVGDVADLSIGRLPYFAGVGNGTLDGALAALYFNAVQFKLYGGARVPDDLTLNGWKALSRNFVAGGQVVTTAIQNARLSLSYVNQQRERTPYWALRADSLFNTVDTYITPQSLREQFLSFDGSYRFSSLSLYGRYDYDLNGDKTQRGQLGARFSLTEDVSMSGDFIHRAPRIAYNSFFAVFSTESVNEFELGGDYRFLPAWRAFLRGALVSYTDDESFRWTVGFAHTYCGLTYRGTSGYAGTQNTVSFQGSYPLFEYALVPHAGVSLGSYKLNAEAETDNALSVILGATVRPASMVSFDLQGQVVSNKIVSSDVRFFGTFTYWFAERAPFSNPVRTE